MSPSEYRPQHLSERASIPPTARAANGGTFILCGVLPHLPTGLSLMKARGRADIAWPYRLHSSEASQRLELIP